MTISPLYRYTPAQRASEAPAAPATGLADEHGQLLRQVVVRAEALLSAAAAGGWPAAELQSAARLSQH